MAIPSRFHKGDKVYAPRYLIFPERLNARSRFVKVQFDDGLIKVCLSCDCDRA